MDSNRNIYRDDVNFAELASLDTDFAKVLKSNGQLDFSDPNAIQQLTKSLLNRDFNLRISLPPDRLCPPVPNRLNYILWIQDLLDTTSPTYSDRYDPKREVIGLDIGTGASCIYPLLGCAQRTKWRFVATEIDEYSLQYAQANISANNLSSRIKLLKTAPLAPLIPFDTLGLETIDFTVCNPPFYSTPAELLSNAAAKHRPANSACTGAISEMVYEAPPSTSTNPTLLPTGGEIGFVTRMITESLQLRDRVQWYTSMLGKLSSVPVVIGALRDAGVRNWAVAEFVQGTRTRRWGVGWSFMGRRPRAAAARAVRTVGSGVERRWLPFPGEWMVEVNAGEEVEGVGRKVDGLMKELPLRSWMWKRGIGVGVGFARGNVWSRAARRKRGRDLKGGEVDEHDEEESDDDEDMTFGFKITVRSGDEEDSVEIGEKGERNQKAVQVVVRWLEGFDSALFESFCGMIKRKLEE